MVESVFSARKSNRPLLGHMRARHAMQLTARATTRGAHGSFRQPTGVSQTAWCLPRRKVLLGGTMIGAMAGRPLSVAAASTPINKVAYLFIFHL